MTDRIKKELILEGLDCANCAEKIEKEVTNIEGIEEISVDFVTKKLKFVLTNENDADKVTKEIIQTVNRIEPEIKVIQESQLKNLTENKIGSTKKLLLVVGTIIFLFGTIFDFQFWIELVIFLTSYILIGGEIILKALRNIKRGQIFDENFLMSIATIGAFAIGEFPEGVAVMLFYQVGEIFQSLAVNKSRKSISELMDIRPDFANLKIDNDIKKVSPEQVKVNDIIIVKPGEKIPLDGIIIEGKSMVDTSALTGESVPRDVKIGSEVLSGFINKNAVILIKVTKVFGESTVSKILDLVQNATSKKAPTQNFITKFAKYYTPIVILIAVLISIVPLIFIQDAKISEWIYRSLIFLVISCPCALVISIPLGFFGGIGGASKQGILVKGGNYLEALNNVETVIFDKTGTLTKGVFEVTEINTEDGISGEELIEYAAYSEYYSNHPIAISILNYYDKEINKSEIENHEEVSGYGIKSTIKGKHVIIGNIQFMHDENIEVEQVDTLGTIVYIVIDRKYSGYIVISDEIKEDSQKTISSLKKSGIKRIVMLTGDIKSVGETIAKKLGIDEVYTELLPNQKIEKLETIEKQKTTKGKIVFVGDGTNDAPSLARADIGIAMGGLGSDAAIEAADIVIMTDEPFKITKAIKIAKKTRKIVWQNIVFSMLVKSIVLVLGAGGIATMWEAVFADVGVTIIAVINSMRAMKADND